MSSVRRSHRSQSGFSLAEVFVATAIFAVIFIAALLVYDRSNKVFKAGVEAADLQQNTRVAFDKLMADTRLAGFDFDRDGVPTAFGQAQQPDEQIEYAGRSAITIRGNFNYNAAEQGRVAALEPPADPDSQFPIVTTGNDEIVTYALVPDSAGAVTENLVFYADVTDGTVAKRQSYPGGSIEDTITITGVDLCDDDKNGDGIVGCDQPPYTLYRFTVNATGGVERTPLANNIRDLKFTYYNDITGTSALAVTDPGGGPYDPGTPATLNAAARIKRAEIKAIRLSLVGLNQSGDTGWTQVGEPIASVQNRRQYTLESMVVPRNLGKRGMREQETAPPGEPVLKTVCFNYCGLVRLTWEAPPDTLTTGEVETYQVLWDTDIGDDMTEPPQEAQSAGLATTTVIAGLDPNTEYRFSVAATNSYGTTYATEQVVGKPLNATTPEIATITSVTGSSETGSPVAEPNKIRLTWTLPTKNIDAAKMKSCVTASADGTTGSVTTSETEPEKLEMQGIEVWRSTDPLFDPTASPLPASTVKVATASASAGGYNDTTAANCVEYYYRIRIIESCGEDPTKNIGTVVGQSDFYPAVGDEGKQGKAESFEEPSKPGPLVVNVAASSCTGSGAAAECTVTMSWPEVKSDLAGNTIAIDTYELQIVNSSGSTTRNVSVSAGSVAVAGGIATLVATVPKSDPITLVDYVNEFSVRAKQCVTAVGEYSASDTYPKCIFAGGETLTVTPSGINAGTGTSGDPFEILGAETITFSVPTDTITQAAVSIFNADTGTLVQNLTPVTGSTNVLSVPWPDSADNTNFRVDYVVTDGSSPGCTRSGSIYIRETLVTCPFVILTGPTTTDLTDPTLITFGLKNQTDFDITFVKAEVTWNELTAHSTREVTMNFVKLPSGSGSGTVNATLTGSTTATGTVTATSASAAKVFANDMTGNYLVQVIFSTTGNKDLEGQPISNIVIFYSLPGDAVGEVRSCDVF